MAKDNSISVWVRMDDSIKAKTLLKVAIFSRYINAKSLAAWCFNRIATKHISVKRKPPDYE